MKRISQYREIKCLWCSTPKKRILRKDSMLWLWKVSTIIRKYLKKSEIYVCSQFVILYFVDDYCQYWLNKTAGTLTSPNFGINNVGGRREYNDNLNCTWTLTTNHGFYITLEIDYFWVNNNKNNINFYNFSNKFYNSSLILVTIYQHMMDQISSHHQYQNWMRIPMIIWKLFQA